MRAKLRAVIRRLLLAKYDDAPDQERGRRLVIKQTETFANEWAPAAP